MMQGSWPQKPPAPPPRSKASVKALLHKDHGVQITQENKDLFLGVGGFGGIYP